MSFTLLFHVCVCVCVCVNHSVVSISLRSYGLLPTRLLRPWNSPGKNTEVDCHSLLQRILPTQGSKPGLLQAGRFFTVWATGWDWRSNDNRHLFGENLVISALHLLCHFMFTHLWEKIFYFVHVSGENPEVQWSGLPQTYTYARVRAGAIIQAPLNPPPVVWSAGKWG